MSAVFAWSAETVRHAVGLAPVGPARIYSPARMSGAVDDGELLRRIATGDRDAFRLLWERFAGRVHSLLRLLAPEPAVAEDLLQETFLAVWRRAESYRPDRGDVSGWLFAIARNAVFDHRRRVGVRERYDPLVAGPTTTGGNGRDLRILVDQALSALTPEQRHAVHMTYFAGYTYEETAERLDVPLGTLKSRIRAALKRLRGELGEEAAR